MVWTRCSFGMKRISADGSRRIVILASSLMIPSVRCSSIPLSLFLSGTCLFQNLVWCCEMETSRISMRPLPLQEPSFPEHRFSTFPLLNITEATRRVIGRVAFIITPIWPGCSCPGCLAGQSNFTMCLKKRLWPSIIDFEVIHAVNSGRRSIPLIIYFPNKEELEKANYPVTAGKRVLQEAGIAYTDLTSCLLKVNPDDRFGPASRHYSPQGNAAVGNCLHTVVNEALAQAS